MKTTLETAKELSATFDILSVWEELHERDKARWIRVAERVLAKQTALVKALEALRVHLESDLEAHKPWREEIDAAMDALAQAKEVDV